MRLIGCHRGSRNAGVAFSEPSGIERTELDQRLPGPRSVAEDGSVVGVHRKRET